ncbi:peptidylprolyl isomerase [Deinococcus cavernae]|uniref:Peptidyl-prolyl cis-trans isomerase n=1 Tax=Deinococcus cavernae TaxID=2320857 RepID=A0A418V4N5_9DEIO|nr:peptidylprolyl isomerase [Deinococcus cavernae]RJF71076.1 peptidylprolyl isomerase [Deinococcus cavernae]
MTKSLSLLPVTLLLFSCAPVAQTTKTPAQPAPVVPAPAPVPARAPAAPAGYTLMAPLSTAPVRQFDKAAQVIDPARFYRAVMNTGKGTITIDLNAKAAPVAVNNFVFLALNHFYDGTRFHRVIDGFMAQGGDPNSADLTRKAEWGTGGPGYRFMAENRNGLKFDRPGVLGMARAASLDSQGSQFYLTLAAADFLDGQYTVFGQVVDGMAALNSLTKTSQTGAFGEQPIAGAEADVLNSVQIYVK